MTRNNHFPSLHHKYYLHLLSFLACFYSSSLQRHRGIFSRNNGTDQQEEEEESPVCTRFKKYKAKSWRTQNFKITLGLPVKNTIISIMIFVQNMIKSLNLAALGHPLRGASRWSDEVLFYHMRF